MAAPKKKGLDYFPLDIGIFGDEKLFDLQNEYGPLGEVIYLRLLCLVYKEGYYYKFRNLDTLSAMMIRSIGNRWTKDKKTVKEVILYLAKINLFSEELMQRNVITSRGIQERYLIAMERRQSKIEEYNLLEICDNQQGLLNAPQKQVNVTETPVNVTETAVNVDNNDTKESKGNKSKSDESKEDDNSTPGSDKKPAYHRYGEYKHVRLTDEEYSRLLADYGEAVVVDYIRRCDEYVQQTGRKYKDFNLTLRQWIRKDREKGNIQPKQSSYDISEIDEFQKNFLLGKGGQDK